MYCRCSLAWRLVIRDPRDVNGFLFEFSAPAFFGRSNRKTVVDTAKHLIVTHDVMNTGSDRTQPANVAREAVADHG